MIAALFVEKGGCYYDLPDVDPWPKDRDARKYKGPHRVIAHPPCERWGRMATRNGGLLGNDDGCFIVAFTSVWLWGGVLEHPADSRAWKAHGLNTPPRKGGWINAGRHGLWTCCVEQGHYGHRARKATWLLAKATEDRDGRPRLPELKWGKSNYEPTRKMREAETEAQRIRARRTGVVQNLSAKQRRATPVAFRDLLIHIADPSLLTALPENGR